MPSVADILESKQKKKFKKRPYRPWNMDGDSTPPSTQELDTPKVTNNNEAPSLAKFRSISTDSIVNWTYHDRPEAELGNIKALAEEFKTIGQQQPCIVRPYPSNNDKYELIVGERRWRAAREAGLPLKVLIQNLNDSDSALIQASENSSRKDLSDYAKGMSYNRLINDGIVSHKQLFEKLGISKQKLSSLLSFKNLPAEFTDKITSFENISARTAEAINSLWKKGPDYQEALLSYLPNIEDGRIGHVKLLSLVDSKVNKPTPKRKINEKILSRDGRHLFTWREDNNMQPSIHFPSDIVHLLKNNKLSQEQTTQKFVQLMEDMLKEISE